MSDILAGPIVRRATENRVCVWIVLRYKQLLMLSIMDGDGKILGASDPSDLDSSCCRVGEKLFVYLLQARPSDSSKTFPKNQLLHYQLQIGDQTDYLDLKTLGLTYSNSQHPSFYIPEQLPRLLHGSCRKPHGLESLFKKAPGHMVQDGLSNGDDLLQQTWEDLSQRPAILLLTGDQIYADDVAASVLAMLVVQAKDLLGFDEKLPGDFGAITPSAIPVNGRQEVARGAGFSSREAENHLLAFGEFAALYLYVLGNAGGWQPDLSMEREVERKQAVERFHGALPKIRRLLANIPTYMIFDDHEVTDDWNITGYWYDRVRGSATGRRVVANALAAYFSFQGWGNDPDNFDRDLRWTVESFLMTPDYQGPLAQRFDFQMWKHRGWGFSIPTDPPIVAIDSRTQRQPSDSASPPQLLDRYALDWLCLEWLKLTTRPENFTGVPLFITTTPVMGVAPVVGLQRAGIWLAGLAESYKWVPVAEKFLGMEGFLAQKVIESLDAEAWVSNREGFARFLATLTDRLGITRCCFLSGDVRYSFSASASFERKDQPTLSCLQLTSSALCNRPSEKTERTLEKLSQWENGSGIHSDPPLWPFKHWTARIQLIAYRGSQSKRVTAHCNVALVEFSEGQPTVHRLLDGEGENRVFPLPKIGEFR